MRTLLVLAKHPVLAEDIRAALDAAKYRVVHRVNLDDAEPMLAHGLIDFCLVDAELIDLQGVWVVEKLRQRLPHLPVFVCVDSPKWDLEEEAWLAGVQQILKKPIRGRVLDAMLQRHGGAPGSAARPAPARPPSLPPPVMAASSPNAVHSLEMLRDFSAILASSLSAEALLKKFLLLLREITGVNRAAIFLRQPVVIPGGTPNFTEGRALQSACAIGLPPGVLEHLQLSIESGIGGHVFHEGRILWRDGAEARADAEIEREFSLLGVQVVVPILDRETFVGLAAFDGRITGQPLTVEELELIFHLLEEVGLAVRNIWLHDQLAANQKMLADILHHFSSACILINRDLKVLHCTDSARRLFLPAGQRDGELQFSDLPVSLGSKAYHVLKSGAALAPFRHQPADNSRSVYQVSIVPFQSKASPTPDSALVVIEDRTQTEQLQHLEVETANLRLVKAMAERLAHEIGNALVPVATHQQLLADRYLDPDFRESLDQALSDGVKRISRLVNQMRFLARDTLASEESFPLGPLIEEAFREAQKHQPVKSALLKYDDANEATIITGDRAALKHALLEVLLNALQANLADARIVVRLKSTPRVNGSRRACLEIEVQDNGTGFTPEALENVPAPFFTTRNVGLGLGLTVTRKILETHHGKLEIEHPPANAKPRGVVRIILPQAKN